MTSEAQVDFNAPAVLRKWPSFNNERRTDSTAPIQSSRLRSASASGGFMARPAATRHLYDTETRGTASADQRRLVRRDCRGTARLREFL
jgi:hypothetical protein